MHQFYSASFRKVLWVKFGWSDYYRGGPIDGNFGWLKAHRGKKDEGRGHEAFNFMPGGDGTYYCYVPPQAKTHCPEHEDDHGWTVICLAKNPKRTGVHIVGWYENATLLGEWKAPPQNHPAGGLYEWSYCIESKSAFFIPPNERTLPFSDPSIRQGKYSFLAGPGIETGPDKKRVLALLKQRVGKLRKRAVHNPSEADAPDPELNPVDPFIGFGSPEHRRKVEKAAEAAVIRHFAEMGFRAEDRTKVKCGYDFLVRKGRTTFHVEIKGTAGDTPGFFLTRNEHAAGYQANPAWRLAMVTRALSSQAKVEIFDAKALRRSFELTPYVFLGRPIIQAAESA